MSCAHITAPLQRALSTCFEWHDASPIVVFCGDVLAAFDHMRPRQLAGALRRKGLPGWLVAALLREGCGLKMVPEFEATMAGTAEGSISQPFRSEFGWHILEVKARRDKDFSGEVRRNQVAGYIRDQKYQEELDAWLRKIREEAFVDIK